MITDEWRETHTKMICINDINDNKLKVHENEDKLNVTVTTRNLILRFAKITFNVVKLVVLKVSFK